MPAFKFVHASDLHIDSPIKGLRSRDAVVGARVADAGYQALNNLVELCKREEVDFLLIDCPPALGMLSLNAMYAARFLVVPVEARPYSLDGLVDLVNTARTVWESGHPLDVLGVLITRWEGTRVERDPP